MRLPLVIAVCGAIEACGVPARPSLANIPTGCRTCTTCAILADKSLPPMDSVAIAVKVVSDIACLSNNVTVGSRIRYLTHHDFERAPGTKPWEHGLSAIVWDATRNTAHFASWP